MTKKDELDDLLGGSKPEKQARKNLSSEDILASILGDGSLKSSKRMKVLQQLEAVLDTLDIEESNEPETTIMLDLAPCQGIGLMHCGVHYLHGGRYTVTQNVANDLLEMTRRGHSHEASITKSENSGWRKRRNLDVNTPMVVRNPATGGVMSF